MTQPWIPTTADNDAQKWAPNLELNASDGGVPVWSGSEWRTCPIRVWDGGQWIGGVVKTWTGSTWKEL